jgi:hypothetical protein
MISLSDEQRPYGAVHARHANITQPTSALKNPFAIIEKQVWGDACTRSQTSPPATLPGRGLFLAAAKSERLAGQVGDPIPEPADETLTPKISSPRGQRFGNISAIFGSQFGAYCPKNDRSSDSSVKDMANSPAISMGQNTTAALSRRFLKIQLPNPDALAKVGDDSAEMTEELLFRIA